jgi:membrane protease YdiL (CAAX protease family)
MLAVASAAGLTGFAVLARAGTWVTFLMLGVPIAMAALALGAVPAALLRPSIKKIVGGLLVGVLMTSLTHATYALVALLLPEVRAATARLFVLLEVGHFSPVARGGLIVIIATCEEIIFRGALPVAPSESKQHPLPRVARGDFLRVVVYATGYALAAAPLGSPLLVICALCCGVVWGAARVVTDSLVVPIVAHVVWDLGVLVAWPLLLTPGAQ